MRELTPILAVMLFMGLALIAFVVWRVKTARADREERAAKLGLPASGNFASAPIKIRTRPRVGPP